MNSNEQLQTKIIIAEDMVLNLFKRAEDLHLELSNNEEDYHLTYIAKKITECSVCMEKLSDIQMALTKISLDSTIMGRAARSVLERKREELMAGPDYSKVPALGRPLWMSLRTEQQEKVVLSLDYLGKTLAEVRQATADKMSTFKRLDSDIRLHQKLIETKNGSGTAAPGVYAGVKDKDLEL